jgi:hypothetical protein
MAKMHKRIAAAENQASLFDLIRQEVDAHPDRQSEGSLNFTERLRLSLLKAMNHPRKSRWQIAGEMSHLLATEVSKHQLDGWVAESKAHRFPAEYLHVFCRVTETDEPLRILAEGAGVYLMKSEEALRSEIQKLDEEERKIRSEKKRRMVFLEAWKNGGKT